MLTQSTPQVLEEEKVNEQLAARNIPDFGPGAVLEVKLVGVSHVASASEQRWAF